MRIVDKIFGIGLTALIGLSGYLIHGDIQRYKEETERAETISGYPISVEHDGNYGATRLSTMIKDKEGKYILCQCKRSAGVGLDTLKATSIIESEMNDGDNEPIELKGIYRENIFEIFSVSANGYTASR